MPNITLAERIAGQYYDPAVFKTNVYDSGASQDGWVLVENWHKFVSDLRAIYTSVRASSSTISSLVTKLDMDLPANPGSRFPRDVGNPWDENYREVTFYRLDSKTREHIEALSRISDQSSSSGGGGSGVGVNPTPTSTGDYTSLSSREGVGGSGGGGGIINCGNCCPRYTQVDAALNYTNHFVAAATSKFSMYKRSDFEKEFKLIWLQHNGNSGNGNSGNGNNGNGNNGNNGDGNNGNNGNGNNGNGNNGNGNNGNGNNGNGNGNENENENGNGTSSNNNCEDAISKLKEELKAAEEDRDKWRDKFEKKPPIGGADTP